MAPDHANNVQSPRANAPEMATQVLQEASSLGYEDASPTRSASGSMNSVSTATYKWEEQEAEKLFCQRVEKLCQLLWPPPKSMKHRLSNRLRANKLFRSLVPAPETPLIERLKGGDLNHITGITLPSWYSEGNRNLILRVPRWDQNRLDRDMAVLDYVRQKTCVPVVTIAATDFSCSNPLEKPYVLQHRIPGSDLNTVWDNLSHSQRCIVAGELGRIVRTLLSLESPVAGIIEAAPASTGAADSFSIVPFELDMNGDDLVDEPKAKAKAFIDVTAPPTRQTTLDIFKTQFERWRTVALAHNCGSVDNEVELWDSMLKAVHDMDDLGLLRTDLNCLCHVDLHSGNIMVRSQTDMSIEITAILDWDEAVFAPKFVNCMPPAWLWDDEYENHFDENDLDPWPYELEGANTTPPTLEKQEIKRIFEEHAGPEYPHLAYDEHFRLTRGLFRVAKDGLDDSNKWKAVERILGEWETLRQSLIETEKAGRREGHHVYRKGT